MAAHQFDSLYYVKTLEKAGVSREVAEAQAELMRDSILREFATKTDLENLEQKLEYRIDRLEERLTAKIKQSEQSSTIRTGLMLAAAVAILVGIDRFLGT